MGDIRIFFSCKVAEGTRGAEHGQFDYRVLQQIQQHFHAVIRERAGDLIDQHNVQLPELVGLRMHGEEHAWFPVPGMYGGFKYWLIQDGDSVKLIAESWSRVVEGSGQRHEITVHGSQLVDEGFV